MNGLTESEFDCLFECLEPFLSTLIYPDCKSSRRSKCKKCFKYMHVILILRPKVQLGIKFNVQCGIKTTIIVFGRREQVS